MRNFTVMTGVLLVLAILGMSIPSLAKGDDGDRGRGPKVQVQILNGNDADENRAFQQWYNAQTNRYTDIDPESGERLGDLLQLVVEVAPDRLMVLDRQNIKRPVFVTNRTQVLFPEIKRTRGENNPFSHRNGPKRDNTALIRNGDLVIVEGYLRSTGGVTGTRLRVVGRAYGWSYDDGDWGRPSYGVRLWGEVRTTDYRSGSITVDTNKGYRQVALQRDGQLLVNGRQESLSYLRRGDRLVIYADRDDNRTISAFRIMVLNNNDQYPDGDKPHWCDPDNHNGANDDYDRGETPMVDGTLRGVSTSLLFNRLVMDANGRQVVIRVAKSLDAIDRDGDKVSVFNLREGEPLRVYYTEVGGEFFAKRIEVQ